MRNLQWLGLLGAAFAPILVLACRRVDPIAAASTTDGVLPQPATSSSVSLEEALRRRRSLRELAGGPLSQQELSQLLWAAQGITDASQGYRTAPSAGALFPFDVYVVGASGAFAYRPKEHALGRVLTGDLRASLTEAAGGQACVADAAVSLVLVADLDRLRPKYGDRAERYAAMEAGHIAQNVLLEATALGLGAVPVGAVDDGKLRKLLGLGPSFLPLYVVPVGRPRASP